MLKLRRRGSRMLNLHTNPHNNPDGKWAIYMTVKRWCTLALWRSVLRHSFTRFILELLLNECLRGINDRWKRWMWKVFVFALTGFVWWTWTQRTGEIVPCHKKKKCFLPSTVPFFLLISSILVSLFYEFLINVLFLNASLFAARN